MVGATRSPFPEHATVPVLKFIDSGQGREGQNGVLVDPLPSRPAQKADVVGLGDWMVPEGDVPVRARCYEGGGAWGVRRGRGEVETLRETRGEVVALC